MLYLELLIMVAVALAAGLFPLYVSLNLQIVGSLGAGVILGTAFTIVIPEGVEVTVAADGAPVIGLPLLLGYLAMYLIDALFELRNQAPEPTDLGSMRIEAHNGHSRPVPGFAVRSCYLSFTSLAMFVHAFADGVSFGAASLLESPKVRLSILLAILVHKAPAAFSFASVLLNEGLSTHQVFRDVTVFALCTPLGAILVRLSVHNARHFMWWAGQGLLFSAGSFTFVALHVQPLIQSQMDIAAVLGGVAIPVLASLVKED